MFSPYQINAGTYPRDNINASATIAGSPNRNTSHSPLRSRKNSRDVARKRFDIGCGDDEFKGHPSPARCRITRCIKLSLVAFGFYVISLWIQLGHVPPQTANEIIEGADASLSASGRVVKDISSGRGSLRAGGGSHLLPDNILDYPSSLVRACPKSYSDAVDELHLEQCSYLSPERRDSLRVIMVWTTPPETFTARNQWTVESLLKNHPCASVSVYSNTLPLQGFKTFRDYGFDVTVKRYAFAEIVTEGEPGHKWTAKMDQNRNSPHFHVHTSDMLRLLLLYKHGGSYVDMDHITVGPILGQSGPGKNVFGGEVCRNDNPDCMNASKLVQLKVIDTRYMDTVGSKVRAGFHSLIGGVAPRYTPCNGLLLNWEKKHHLIEEALRDVENSYDPDCWGCLGPRLFGRLLNEAVDQNRTVESVKILPPGILFPVDYSQIGSLLRREREDVETFMEESNALGVHFYGKTTTGVKIEQGSTMEKVLRKATIFGKLPFVLLERLGDNRAFCVFDRKETDAINEIKGRMFAKAWKMPSSLKTYPENLTDFFIQVVKANNNVLGCHEGWPGIREMTYKIGKNTNMPVLLFNDKSLHEEQEEIYSFLFKLGVTSLHVQGIPPGLLGFATFLSHKQEIGMNPMSGSMFVSASYHSGVGTHNSDPFEAALVGRAMESSKKGELFLTFIEPDQAEYATRLGAPSCAVWPTFTRKPEFKKQHRELGSTEPLRIGILGMSHRITVKNFFPQAAAACMFDNAEIYVNYLKIGGIKDIQKTEWHLNLCKGEFVELGWLASKDFQEAIQQNDINLYVSVSDAVPNVVLDSLAVGIPVISSDTNSFYQEMPFLKELLTEPRIDDQSAIYHRAEKAIEYVAKNRDLFEVAVGELFDILNVKARASWDCLTKSKVGFPMCRNEQGVCTLAV